MREKVVSALNKIRPSLQADGGDVELAEATLNYFVKITERSVGFFKKCIPSEINYLM